MTTVTIDGFQFRIHEREDGSTAVYKTYPTGKFFRESLIWDSRRHRGRCAPGAPKMPRIGSPVARALAAASRAYADV